MVQESRPHEVWVELFRQEPGLVLALVRRARARGVGIPKRVEAAVVGSEVIKSRPESLRADLVIRVRGPGAARSAMVVEVQLGEDADKRLKWPAYVAGVRAELACPVVLVVVAPRADVARWARMDIETGHPGFVLRPVVLGPEAIPVIADARTARRDVRLAVLSAMAHGRGERGYDVGLAALRAVALLDEGRRGDYATYVLDALDDAYVQRLEDAMEQGEYRELTSLERHFIEKGEAKGKAEAMQHGVLRVLAARGIDVPDEMRDRVLACGDVRQLELWLTRAATAERADDVLGG